MKLGPFTIERRILSDDVAELRQLQKLYAAAVKDDLSTLKTLFADGFDFQLRDDKMRSLVHVAHRGEVIAFLIECGCDPLALDAGRSTTLMHSGLDAQANKFLLAHSVDVHAHDIYGNTALYRQCDFSGIGWDNPNLEALQVLLDAGVAAGNEAEIEMILQIASSKVTGPGEYNDVGILENFLKKYLRPT